jgi:hypothetical protein
MNQSSITVGVGKYLQKCAIHFHMCVCVFYDDDDDDDLFYSETVNFFAKHIFFTSKKLCCRILQCSFFHIRFTNMLSYMVPKIYTFFFIANTVSI